MSVLEEIKILLNSNNIAYKVFEHPPVHTSLEAARIRDTDISMGAKALVLYADKTPVLVVVPGDKKLDFRKFKSEFKIKDLRLASPEEVTKLTTLVIGSIPPVGKVLKLQSYFDESFLEKDMIAFNAGSLTTSITMHAKDLIKVESPMLSSIT